MAAARAAFCRGALSVSVPPLHRCCPAGSQGGRCCWAASLQRALPPPLAHTQPTPAPRIFMIKSHRKSVHYNPGIPSQIKQPTNTDTLPLKPASVYRHRRCVEHLATWCQPSILPNVCSEQCQFRELLFRCVSTPFWFSILCEWQLKKLYQMYSERSSILKRKPQAPNPKDPLPWLALKHRPRSQRLPRLP